MLRFASLLVALWRACAAPLELGAVPPLGERTVMRSGADNFQLFLPQSWRRGAKHPMLIFLHGSGDGPFDVMNSQSLPRLLSRDQSTAFDAAPAWTFTFDGRFYSNATFASECGFVVLMPQGWLFQERGGWSHDRLDAVQTLATKVAEAYDVDPDRISLAGQSAGGVGAYAFALRFPRFLAALVVVCGAVPVRLETAAQRLAGLPVWVFHGADDVAMPVDLADGAVAVLGKAKDRIAPVRYTRYAHAPAPPDPRYSDMTGHASYDLAFRDAELYAWLKAQSRATHPHAGERRHVT
ncbi:Alpha/Beta hydrolase protein [Pelagophyceae sp. CCMP2097]|nr:Alpha/Beta hydrolase protein [Pelagophyceae sp. CCMP2097]|mmetsp:Transcript_31500/g.106064  ORF Transcript_31500/g.106064 Transcript_31500/m.106064 type:complete len:295 (+) Transcript_31500:163-1047(+)